jgi:ferritin-like metal-binding protein YciE
MKFESLQDLFVEELKDIYNAENQLTKALPKMAKAASSDELRTAFESHLEETKGQIDRLEQIFKSLDMPLRGKKCVAMQGLIEEGKELMQEDMSEPVLDAALIAAAQKVEHYEIAAYGTLRTYAQLLGLDEAAELLQATLDEESATDEKLTGIAQNINAEAESAA